MKRFSPSQIIEIDRIVAPLIKKGQSIHHIYYTNPSLINICSERTIRRMIYENYLSIKAYELPRWTRYTHPDPDPNPREGKVNQVESMFKRTYSDFLRYVKSHPDMSIVQYDLVIGKTSDKYAILTITLPKERFQFGRLIKKGNPNSANEELAALFHKIGLIKVQQVFPINLADNGIEFSYLHQMEILNLRVYFTNPYRSTDKAACERNHEFIRYIIPKGKSLNFLTQEKFDLMFYHINSYTRESNYNKTPFDLTEERFGIDFLNAIGIKRIAAQDVL